MNAVDPDVSQLSETFIGELIKALALPQTDSIRSAFRLAFGRAARRFSELVLGLDRKIAQGGVASGARWLLPKFVAGYRARGVEKIPQNGPLLIVSNHPGAYDAMVISAYMNRPDYKIVISEIPPYRYLPNVSRHAIFSAPVTNIYGRMHTVRSAIRHLKTGGALLIFPRGRVEPDPAFMPKPDAEFDQWSRSLEILLRHVPRCLVLVTLVSGVISPSAMQHPITLLRKARPDRQRLAFIYQIFQQVLSGEELYGLTPRVTFGEILSGAEHQHLLAKIEQSARQTLELHLS